MLIIRFDKKIEILLCPTIILFLIIPCPYSLPTKILTNIAIKSPIYIINSFNILSKYTPSLDKYLNNVNPAIPIVKNINNQNITSFFNLKNPAFNNLIIFCTSY